MDRGEAKLRRSLLRKKKKKKGEAFKRTDMTDHIIVFQSFIYSKLKKQNKTKRVLFYLEK